MQTAKLFNIGRSQAVRIDFLLDTDTCIYLIKTPLAFT